jgi:Protein of unknown function (DUF2752)
MILGGVGLGLLVLYCFEPGKYPFYPFCPFHILTGLNCPACGSLRALHQLSHGNILAALHFNSLLIVSLPFLGIVLARKLSAQITGSPWRPIEQRPFLWWLFVGVFVGFGILRNLPFTPFNLLGP